MGVSNDLSGLLLGIFANLGRPLVGLHDGLKGVALGLLDEVVGDVIGGASDQNFAVVAVVRGLFLELSGFLSWYLIIQNLQLITNGLHDLLLVISLLLLREALIGLVPSSVLGIDLGCHNLLAATLLLELCLCGRECVTATATADRGLLALGCGTSLGVGILYGSLDCTRLGSHGSSIGLDSSVSG
ncbi:hypothetical protein PG984_014096 [Apiospora sp. TS-2023a]